MVNAGGEASEVEALLKQNAEAERRLLKRERQAEREVAEARENLAKAEDRLLKARKRVDQRVKALAAAEEALATQRAARMYGPASLQSGEQDTPGSAPPSGDRS